jgi:hypothetical protein
VRWDDVHATVRSCVERCASSLLRLARSCGRNPSKMKRSAGNPDALSAATTAARKRRRGGVQHQPAGA